MIGGRSLLMELHPRKKQHCSIAARKRETETGPRSPNKSFVLWLMVRIVASTLDCQPLKSYFGRRAARKVCVFDLAGTLRNFASAERDNGRGFSLRRAVASQQKTSVNFTGYWQRHIPA
jgi:hypothetical protein